MYNKETKTVEKLKPEELEKELLKLINEARTEAKIAVLELPTDENAAKLAEYLALGKTDEYEAELAKLNAEHSGKCQISGYDTAQKAFEALQADENNKKDNGSAHMYDDSTYGDSNQCKSGRFKWKYVNRDGDK